jgi:hypothetical protein
MPLAHKAEPAVDLSSGARGPSRCRRPVTGIPIGFTGHRPKCSRPGAKFNARAVEEVLADQGYHSAGVLKDLH